MMQLIALHLYQINQKNGRPAIALKYFETYTQLKDNVSNNEVKKELLKSQYQAEYQTKSIADSLKIGKERELTSLKLQQEQTQRYALYTGLAMVLVFAGFVFNRFKVTQKQKYIIELKEKETQQQNEIITHQKHLVEEKHKEITDSINYAELIQRSFLATNELLDANLASKAGAEYFVLFKPKDVVSGDFYYAKKLSPFGGAGGGFLLYTADSTGHGVPGAIMSLLNITSLEKAVDKTSSPAEILNQTRLTIIERLKKDGSTEGGKDGMDCSLLHFEFPSLKERDGRVRLKIAAANNPVWIVQASTTLSPLNVIEIKPDKMPVGRHDRQDVSFTAQEIELQKGDVVYTLTDGFPDQFGGEKGKKFMSKNLRELLVANAHLPMQHQKELLEDTFTKWVGSGEQIDDVTVIGIRV